MAYAGLTNPIEAAARYVEQAGYDPLQQQAIVAGFAQTGVVSGCAVTAQGSPDTTVAVAAGTIVVLGTLHTVAAGNVTGFTAPSAGLRRIDLVVVDVTGAKSRLAGTAVAPADAGHAGPVWPAAFDPTVYAVLAEVTLDAADATVVAGCIVDKRVVTHGPYPPADPQEIHLSNPVFGAYMDGVHDDTAAMALVDAVMMDGGTLVISGPVLLNTNWVPSKVYSIKGTGYTNGAQADFGDSAWAASNYGATFTGSVLMLAGATSGVGLTLGPATINGKSCRIDDIMILGPNSGTGVGLRMRNMGTGHIGGNVLVAAFAKDIECVNVESCSADAFKARGCHTGINLDQTSNNNSFHAWGVGSSDVSAIIIGGMSNDFSQLELQANTGALGSITNAGNEITLYAENIDATGPLTVSGVSATRNRIKGELSTVGDALTFETSGNYLEHLQNNGPATITVSGTDVTLMAVWCHPTVVEASGGKVVYWDPFTGIVIDSTGIEFDGKWLLYSPDGDGNIYLRDLVNSLMGITLSPGGNVGIAGSLQTGDGGLDLHSKWLFYSPDGNAYVRDEVNGVMALTFGAGATPYMAFNSNLIFQQLGARASGDKYLVVDASGNVHISAVGPAS